jgi:hypothetical protein
MGGVRSLIAKPKTGFKEKGAVRNFAQLAQVVRKTGSKVVKNFQKLSKVRVF